MTSGERSARLLRTLLEEIPDYVYFKDRERRLVVASNAFCGLLGRRMDDILGKRDEDLFPPEVAADTVRDDLSVIESGIPIVGKLEGGADIGGAERWVLTTKIPWRDDRGEVVGLLGISKEVTSRRRAEEDLETSHARMRALLEAVPDMLFRLSRDGVFLDCHAPPHSPLLLPPDAFLGRKVDGILPPQVAGLVLDRIHETLSAERPLTFDYQLPFEDGARDFEARMVPAGEAGEVLVLVRDITELRRSEQERRTLELQLQHAQKLESLGLMAGGIAHDFNNLLTVVLGSVELALSSLDADEPARNHMETCRTAAVRAADLTRQMLAFSGKSVPRVAPVDLSELVRDTYRLLAASLPKSARVELDLAEGSAVMGDAGQLRQVLMNVMLNAAQSLGGGSGTLRVGCRPYDLTEDLPLVRCSPDGLGAGRYTMLEVSDTGVGMDEGTRARVFDPFFTTRKGGHGLGMSVVLGIVRSHRGGICIESEPGRGATVRVLLPAAPMPVAAEVEPPELVLRGRGVVLVVDDEPLVLQLAVRMLARVGFEVLSAGSGPAALECFASRGATIDAVLLDVVMPEMEGPEVFRELRRIRPDVPVLFSSGYAPDLSQILLDPRVRYIQKPFATAHLIETLQALIEEARASAPSG